MAHDPPLRPKPFGWTLIAAAALTGVATAVFGWYVANGGLYSDDWGNAAGYAFAHEPRYWNAVTTAESELGGRPVLALLLPIPHALFGTRPALHLGLAVLLVVLTTLSFYAFLRALRVAPLDALPMAVLALLFPWADAIELWPTASINTVAVILFFTGGTLALCGLDRTGGRAGAFHGAAALCFLLSVLTYEVAGAAALLVGVLYLPRTSRPRALRLWLVDAVVVLAGLAYSLARTTKARHVGSLSARAHDVVPTARQGLSLVARALVPAGTHAQAVRLLVLVSAATVIGLAAARFRRGRSDGSWLLFALGCLVGLAAAYFMFLGSFLHPLDAGPGSRTNVAARFAVTGLVYAVVALAAELLAPSRRTAATLALTGAIAVGYTVHLARDESGWVEAARLQDDTLAAIDSRFPSLRPGTTLATFGVPAEVGPDAPVFQATWDLSGALRLDRRDPTLRAEPVYPGVRVDCTRDGVLVRLPGSRGSATASYRRLYFLDVRTGRSARIDSRRACATAQRHGWHANAGGR